MTAQVPAAWWADVREELARTSEAVASAASSCEAGDYQAATAATASAARRAAPVVRFLRDITRRLGAESRDPRPSPECARCSPPCGRSEQCDTCLRHLAHDFVHWNGAFYQCEHCATVEASTGQGTIRCSACGTGYQPGNCTAAPGGTLRAERRPCPTCGAVLAPDVVVP